MLPVLTASRLSLKLIVTPYNEFLRLRDTRIWVLNNLSTLLSLISSFQRNIISYFVGRSLLNMKRVLFLSEFQKYSLM